MKSTLFTDHQLEQIERAVQAAEDKFPIEIVPVFANTSCNYVIVRFRVMVLALALGLVAAFGFSEITAFAILPFYIKSLILIIWILLCLVIVEFAPVLKRLLLEKERLYETTLSKAKEAFYNHGVYSNPDRIGLLIYISFFERQFHILSDSKGLEIFDETEWEEIAGRLSSEMNTKEPHQAVINCIDNCCKVIADSSIDTNQNPPTLLPNNIRVDE